MTRAISPTGTENSNNLETHAINVVRCLAMDAVQKANSGHPGTPMALAPLAHVLYTRIMQFDASKPDWSDRDRFVLSAGHASMLLYAMLYLTGHGLELDDIRDFRQLNSRTPGHPELGDIGGIETTTGPLGQGFANGVGMAIAERSLRERFGTQVCDHRIFSICSDGDLQEGLSHEAASLAGHLKLGRLVYVYDDNHISIDGPTELSYTDDAAKRFESYGWHVVQLGDVAENLDEMERGIREGMAEEGRPTLVILRSHIGYPSPRFTDTSKAHGEPLGADEIAVVKNLMGMPAGEFHVPDEVLGFYRDAGVKGRSHRMRREDESAAWARANPGLSEEFSACLEGRGLTGWAAKLPSWSAGEEVATRTAASDTLDAIADVVPGLVGGGADLTGNTGTKLSACTAISATDFGGRQIYFGIREHAMASAMNGMAVHGGILPFGGTFMVFSDYMRPAIRLAALMGAKVAFVLSHDSVAVGEDGPTHQPVEHLAALRAIPGLRVIRPADANEVAHAWRIHIEGEGPTALILSRQKLPVLNETAQRAAQGVERGAYVLIDEEPGRLDLILVATGSEVCLAVGARDLLAAREISVRVVSMPSWELFNESDPTYCAEVLPPGVPTVAIEAGITMGWERFADTTVGIDRFGTSAPGPVAMAALGMTAAAVEIRALELLGLDDKDS